MAYPKVHNPCKMMDGRCCTRCRSFVCLLSVVWIVFNNLLEVEGEGVVVVVVSGDGDVCWGTTWRELVSPLRR